MDIQQIKSTTGQAILSFNRQFLEDKVTKTEWLSHWDNDNRVRVTAHEDVIEKIKADPSMKTLALKKEVVLAHDDVKEYTRFVIITPANVEFAI